MSPSDAARDNRVLFLAPTRRDTRTTANLLQGSGILLTCCPTFDALVAATPDGAGALMVPEEAMTPANNARLVEILKAQPAWSDLPILVLAHAGAMSVATKEAVRTLGNVTVLERPLRVPTLLTAVRTALRARQRQYQIREHLADRARAEASLRLSDQRKDEFLATLGHELRNPLAPLVSGMHLIRLEGRHHGAGHTLRVAAELSDVEHGDSPFSVTARTARASMGRSVRPA